ncbi:MAG: indolepyruvate oxidoreductase subunit beta family protein [Alphaproteobacteria bacterium]|nr:indolepyruvate oxidoreductase subunit beta family protein [Alphaproteobacteria bacterium]
MSGIIKLAVMAVGGQGGGVLTNWIENMARAEGYAVQATSVAGVAQRTGATIYYIEMAPMKAQMPVFSLAPAAGDVDILIAAELMEAGRAIMRGFVTPDRTTLIASSHRALAVSEKSIPGDGIADAGEVRAAAEIAAQKLVLVDMEAIAVNAGSVISASLFGALAGANALPFEREAFEAAIAASGKSVEASLRTFGRGFDAAKGGGVDEVEAETKLGFQIQGSQKPQTAWRKLVADVETLPKIAQPMALAGLRKVVDFQNLSYGRTYLKRLLAIAAQDNPKKQYALTVEAAKYIANAMAYDDLIKVADLKTRASRVARVRAEMSAPGDAVMQVTEFMHPGATEIASLMPARMGARSEANPKRMARLDRIFGKARRLRSDTMFGFLQLYLLGGLRWWRPHTRRHAVEAAHLRSWLKTALAYLPDNYDLAVEVIAMRRLVKGYSDTHSRGLSKYDRVLAGVSEIATRKDAADWARRLREAALKDEKGAALDGVLETIRSFN